MKYAGMGRNLLWLTIFICLPAVSDPHQSHSNDSSLLIAHTEWFPYTYTEEGKAKGFELEIFEAVAKSLDISFTFKSYPWSRCLKYLKLGKVDGLISMLKTQERDEFTAFVNEPISVSSTVFIATWGFQTAYTGNLTELKHLNIGVIKDFSYGDTFDNASFLNLDASPNTEQLLSKLIKGRTDLIAENHAVASGTAVQMGILPKLNFLEPPIHESNLHIGFSKANKHEALASAFSSALSEFKKTKAYSEILARYGIRK